ncbi:helix-turn-helix domain-containing protein [Roseococcus sp. SDR]|uniref:hypothetical protein n=1 Tax=Roseococcus sp. SDR TaxID=2835532 RepID=UPI001BCFA3C8|nr:hypothetical protein [Roseococcus sp. SDR]MBS7790085.1 helix-turn-helix domain-containing protein [Roseococcus sp. SDR]MBV1845399.1 helix-turn-helix domain-containing protein [Roseococcus sp. SDR]
MQANPAKNRGNKPEKRPAEPPTNALAYSWAQGAHITGLSVSSLRRRANEGKLKVVRIAGRTLIPAADLKRLVGAEAAQ